MQYNRGRQALRVRARSRQGRGYKDRICRAPLRSAARGPAAQGRVLFLCLPGTYSSARDARLGNVPGYYHSSLAGLEYCGRELVVFLIGVGRAESTPGASPGVSFFVQGQRDTKARRASRGGTARFVERTP